jgi:Fic family protein
MIRLSHTKIQSKIIDFIVKNEAVSAGAIQTYLKTVSRPTLSRYLKELKECNVITQIGTGRSTTYELNKGGVTSYSFDLSLYDAPYQTANTIHFSHTVLKQCAPLFTNEETILLQKTNELYATWEKNTPYEYKELAFERCAIEFSWKSSKIEGNTYTLLETENLIKNKKEASGKTHDEAIMILNQKKVFDCMYRDNLFTTISIATLIDIHTLLVKDLAIPTGLRKAGVGIIGTQYSPLTIQSQLNEALEDLFALLATIKNPLEQAIVALASIAYIQPFADGNKRVSRHFANLILHTHNLSPVAWRTVNEVEYKKAMIAFYELGNIGPIKEMWVHYYYETVTTFFRS